MIKVIVKDKLLEDLNKVYESQIKLGNKKYANAICDILVPLIECQEVIEIEGD